MSLLLRLTLTDYRNHAAAQIACGPGLVVISGDNGAGKTNILEAVSMLAPGRGLRGSPLGEVARRDGPGGWSVAATLQSAAGEVTLGTGTAAAAPERRLVRVNGASASAAALSEWLACVWLTPAMDRLFSDTAGARRRFLDRLVLALHPGHGARVNRYEAAMRERSRLLAGDTAPDPLWLDGLEADMAAHGAVLMAARREMVAALGVAVAAAPDDVFARPVLALAGDADANGDDSLAARLRAGRGRDAAAGRAIEGPHRADLIVTHAAKGTAAAQCSTGEQKALLVAIVLAHAGLVAARQGRSPVLLLDEIAAHLDRRRLAALLARLSEMAVQAWLTGTEPELFQMAPAATRLQIANGLIVPQ